MRTLLRLFEVEFRPPYHHVMPVTDEIFYQVLQVQCARTTVDQCDIVYRKTGLERSIFEQRVQDYIRVCAYLQFDDDAHTFSGGLVIHIDDAVYLLVLHQFHDFLDKLALVYHIRYFGDDYRLPAGFAHLDFGPRPDDDSSPAGLESVPDTLMALDDASSREVRALYVMHQFIRSDVGVVDIRADGVAGLSEIVRSHIGSHTHGDSGRAVEKQERRLCRKDGRLLEGIVEIVLEINGILVDVGHHLLGQFF